jgi:hypothetical protein
MRNEATDLKKILGNHIFVQELVLKIYKELNNQKTNNQVKIGQKKPEMVVHTCNSSTWEAEGGEARV